MPEISSEAFESPFASIILRRNSSRISFCAGRMFSVPNLGMTFSQTKVSRPSKMRLHSALAVYVEGGEGGGAVSGDNHGKIRGDFRHRFCVADNAVFISSVRSAAEKQYIRTDIFDFGGVLLGKLKGIHLDDLGSRAEAGALCRLRGKLRHKSACYHTKTARGGGAGEALSKIKPAGLLFKLPKGVFKPLVYVRLNGGVGGGGSEKPFRVQIDGGDLGICASEVD